MQYWNRFLKIFRDTTEIERDTPENLGMLRNITVAIYITTGLMFVFTFLQGLYAQTAVLGALWLLLHFSGALLLNGKTFPSRFLAPLAILTAVSIIAIQGNGLHDSIITIFPVVIIFASLTMGTRGVLIFATLTTVAIAAIGTLEMTGVAANRFSDLTDFVDIIIIGVVPSVIVAIIQIVLIGRLNKSIKIAQKSTTEQKGINTELLDLQRNLENIISERTQELETQSSQLEQQVKTTQRRTQQFQTIADVARFVANIRDLDTLFKTVAEIITKQLGYYHVGIFLNDEAGYYAILSAANSEGGQIMLARNHRLKVGETGIVGNVAYTGVPRVALDTGEDAIFFNNPDLPGTRSEMAVALKISDQIVGVIDIQSTDANAFSQEDIEVFTAMADQVAIAIENVRLFENTQKSLSESETIYRQYLRSEWGRLSGESDLTGFRYKITGATPLKSRIVSPNIDQAMSTGAVSIHKDEKDKSSLIVPIKLRGEILGIVNVKQPSNKTWSKDEIELIQSIADRVAISAENARLFEESQQRATLEQAIGEISAKLSSSVNLNTVLQTAAEELGHVLHGSEVAIQLIKNEDD